MSIQSIWGASLSDLAKYGTHLWNCPKLTNNKATCLCGMDAALRGTRLVEAKAEVGKWTEKDGRANSSDLYVGLREEIGRIIRDDAHTLIAGRADLTAGMILSQLAYVHGFGPPDSNDALLELIRGARQNIVDEDYNFCDSALMRAEEILTGIVASPPNSSVNKLTDSDLEELSKEWKEIGNE